MSTTGHTVKGRRKRERCGVCQRKHSTLIRQYNRAVDRSTESTHEITNEFVEKRPEFITPIPDAAAPMGLSVVLVVVRKNQNKSSVLTYAFLDKGSKASFCT